MPSSLKKISGNITFEKAKDLILNDGLEEIGPGRFINIGVLHIPSSLKKIAYPNAIEFKNIWTIVFKDFNNSLILNNKKEFMYFIDTISKDINTREKKFHHPSPGALEIQKKYFEGHFTFSNHAALFDWEYQMYIHKIVPMPHEIIFKGDILPNDYIMFISEELISHYDEIIDLPVYYGRRGYEEMYEKIRKKILKKTNYDIYHPTEDNDYILLARARSHDKVIKNWN